MSDENLGRAADRQQVKASKKLEKENLQQEREDLRWVLSTPNGRRFIWRQLGKLGLFRSSFNVDAIVMAALEGERSAANRLLTEVLEADRGLFLLMQNENLNSGDAK